MSAETKSEAGAAGQLTRRHLLMGAALTATAVVAFAREPRETMRRLKPGELESMIPIRIGQWGFETRSGLVLPPDYPLAKSLYSDVLTRVYVSEDRPPVMLLIAYSNTQNGMLQLHRPEVCYPAGGYTLTETKTKALAISPGVAIPARFFSAESPARTEQVMYWTRIGTESPTSWIDQRAAVIRANLKQVIPDGILVRISTVLPDYGSAEPVLREFAASLVKELQSNGRKLLVSG